jgi:hypothetical protein
MPTKAYIIVRREQREKARKEGRNAREGRNTHTHTCQNCWGRKMHTKKHTCHSHGGVCCGVLTCVFAPRTPTVGPPRPKRMHAKFHCSTSTGGPWADSGYMKVKSGGVGIDIGLVPVRTQLYPFAMSVRTWTPLRQPSQPHHKLHKLHKQPKLK